MATLSPLQKRAERKARNGAAMDMNLVALIDVFTILIFSCFPVAAALKP